jgi:serine/threonine protein kinase
MCKVRDDGATNSACHSIVDLADFKIEGLAGKGCIADREWIQSILVPCYVSKTDPKILLDLPSHKVFSLVPLEDGAHGVIEGGIRKVQDVTQRVFIKRSKTLGISLLQEALIQKVVYRSLVRGGFPNGAPQVYDILGLEDGTCCFTMEPKAGQKLHDIIDESGGLTLSKLIIEALFSLAAMLHHIMNDIGMNHRDLKPNNLIIIKRDKPVQVHFKIGGLKYSIWSNFEICFVDFGFSCIGIDEGKGGGSLKLSKEYDETDPCPKEGRDMYMFLAFLYFYAHRKLQREVSELFEKWLDVDGCKMTEFLRSPVTPKDTRYVMDWIYKICGNPQIIRLKTTPSYIIRDLIALTSA